MSPAVMIWRSWQHASAVRGLFIGNDSGLMHIAAAAGVPTLGLFGPTSPTTHGPRGKVTAVVCASSSYRQLRVQSGDAGKKTHCLMDGLTIDQVQRAAIALYRQTSVHFSATTVETQTEQGRPDIRQMPSTLMRIICRD